MTTPLQHLRLALAAVRELEGRIEAALIAVEATMTEQEQDAATDLNRCPSCGGPADNGRRLPPSPYYWYYCTKCEGETY